MRVTILHLQSEGVEQLLVIFLYEWMKTCASCRKEWNFSFVQSIEKFHLFIFNLIIVKICVANLDAERIFFDLINVERRFQIHNRMWNTWNTVIYVFKLVSHIYLVIKYYNFTCYWENLFLNILLFFITLFFFFFYHLLIY